MKNKSIRIIVGVFVILVSVFAYGVYSMERSINEYSECRLNTQEILGDRKIDLLLNICDVDNMSQLSESERDTCTDSFEGSTKLEELLVEYNEERNNCDIFIEKIDSNPFYNAIGSIINF